MARVVTIRIGGETHTIDLDSALRINNADAERHEVAADMAWWGVIAAAAEAQVERLTAAAASWHASALAKCLEVDEKISEWKAKAAATGHAEYNRMTRDIADAKEVAGKAQAVHWALVRKMSMLEAMIKSDSADQRGSNSIGRPPVQSDDRMTGYKNNQSKKTQTTAKEG